VDCSECLLVVWPSLLPLLPLLEGRVRLLLPLLLLPLLLLPLLLSPSSAAVPPPVERRVLGPGLGEVEVGRVFLTLRSDCDRLKRPHDGRADDDGRDGDLALSEDAASASRADEEEDGDLRAAVWV